MADKGPAAGVAMELAVFAANHGWTSKGEGSADRQAEHQLSSGTTQRHGQDPAGGDDLLTAVVVGAGPGLRDDGASENEGIPAAARATAACKQPPLCGGLKGPLTFCLAASLAFVVVLIGLVAYIYRTRYREASPENL
ncbi:uncharacterized protein LOC144095599 [Amblyomma americanum]